MNNAMKMKLLVVGLLSAVSAFGRGVDRESDLTGAWALAESPDVPCLMVTNRVVWSVRDGAWRPSHTVDYPRGEVSFKTVGIDYRGDERDKLTVLSDWQARDFMKQGVAAAPGDVGWMKSFTAGNHISCSNCHRVVRCAPPDWSKIVDPAKYVGVWRPARKIDRHGEVEAVSAEEAPYLMKIRSDGRMIVFDRNTDLSKGDPYSVMALLPAEGCFRFRRGPTPSDGETEPSCEWLAHGPVHGLWIDPHGDFIGFDDDEIVTFARSDAPFVDVVDARAKMADEGAYEGVWGVSVEFTIDVVTFVRNGKGLLSGFMTLVPFTWKSVGKDKIHCTLDRDLAELGGLPFREFDCRYDREANTMVKILPESVCEEMRYPAEGRCLPYMSGQVPDLGQIFERLEKVKTDPQFKFELERVRARRAKATPES